MTQKFSRIALVTHHTRVGQHSPALRIFSMIAAAEGREVHCFESGPPRIPERLALKVHDWEPDLVCISLYLWNRSWSQEFIEIFRQLCEIPIIVGGPESTGDPEGVAEELAADWTVAGEGEEFFLSVLEGKEFPRGIVRTQPVSYDSVPVIVAEPEVPGYHESGLPFVYYESSRGCPSACSFCLSGCGLTFRTKNPERIRAELKALVESGFRGDVRFLDRTANYPPGRLAEILQIATDEDLPFSLLQFEIDPRRLEDVDRNALVNFKQCPLQLEVGVQSLEPAELSILRRVQDPQQVLAVLRDLIEHEIDVHVDLIAGLPHQTLESLGRSFDTLFNLNPASLQCWILKILPGTKLASECSGLQIKHQLKPLYSVRCTPDLKFEELERVGAVAALYTRVWNVGRFRESFRRLVKKTGSAFAALWSAAEGLAGEAAASGLSPAEVAERLAKAAEEEPLVLCALAHELRLTQGKNTRRNPFDEGAGIILQSKGEGKEILEFPFSPLPDVVQPAPCTLCYNWRGRMANEKNWWYLQ